MIEVNSDKVVRVHIISIESNTPQLGWEFKISSSRAPIEYVEYPQFVVLHGSQRMIIYMFFFSAVCFLFSTFYKRVSMKRGKLE